MNIEYVYLILLGINSFAIKKDTGDTSDITSEQSKLSIINEGN